MSYCFKLWGHSCVCLCGWTLSLWLTAFSVPVGLLELKDLSLIISVCLRKACSAWTWRISPLLHLTVSRSVLSPLSAHRLFTLTRGQCVSCTKMWMPIFVKASKSSRGFTDEYHGHIHSHSSLYRMHRNIMLIGAWRVERRGEENEQCKHIPWLSH